MDKTAIIIPAYDLTENEIIGTVNQIQGISPYIFVVYNDTSPSLEKIVRDLEESSSVKAVYIHRQIGKAEALRRGWKKILEDQDVKIIAQIDGDLKQPPEQAKEMIELLQRKDADMVIGNRYTYQDLSDQPHRKTVTSLLSRAVSYLTGCELVDTMCGMRVYRRGLAAEFTKARSFGYGIEMEQIFIASSLGAIVTDYPIHSNLQSNATLTEKVEDAVYSIIIRGEDLKKPIADSAREYIVNALVNLKARQPFIFDLLWVGINERAKFNFDGRIEGKDSFSLTLLS